MEESLVGLVAMGLFPDGLGSLSVEDFQALRMADWRPKQYSIRAASPGDLESLCAIEEACWAPELQQARNVLAMRLSESPKDNFVAVVDGKVVGVVYSRRISSISGLRKSTFAMQPPLAFNDCEAEKGSENGKQCVRQLLAIAVLPSYAALRLGKLLRDFMLQLSRVSLIFSHVAAMSRCSDFPGGNDQAYERHVSDPNADSTLVFHRSGGALCEVVPHYRPEDRWNNGHGVMVSYDLSSALHEGVGILNENVSKGQVPTAVATAALANEADPPKEGIELQAAWKQVMGTSFDTADRKRTWMDLGLTSLDFTQLASLLRIPETLLFDHTTPERLQSHLQARGCETAQRGTTQPDSTVLAPNTPLAPFLSPLELCAATCALPGGASDASSFLASLLAGRDSIVPTPAAWDLNLEGGFLTDSQRSLDLESFGISLAEAEHMDPHQALLLEACSTAAKTFGMLPATLQETAHTHDHATTFLSTGVFIGFSNEEWPRASISAQSLSAYAGTGQSRAIAAGRVSYHLNLVGHALVVDTACSSSLAALHIARRSLLHGTCSEAIAAAADLMLSSHALQVRSVAGMLSKDSRCKTFDKLADGYGRGEGVTAIILHPQVASTAKACCTAEAEIRGARLNQNAHSASLTAPCGTAQQQVIAAALKESGAKVKDVCYVESHGTGTALGDPIEFGALCTVLSGRENPLVVGAVKTNIGHLEGAAGFAGLLKTCAVLRSAEVPANLHLKELSPLCQPKGGFEVVLPTERAALVCPTWEQEDQQRRLGGVSSFGFSGTNGHAIISSTPHQTLPVHRAMTGGPWVWRRLNEENEHSRSGLKNLGEAEAADDVSTATATEEGAGEAAAADAAPQLSHEELLAIVEEAVIRVLPGVDAEDLSDANSSLLDLGLDSLSAIELSHLLSAKLQLSLPAGGDLSLTAANVLREPTVEAVARSVAEAFVTAAASAVGNKASHSSGSFRRHASPADNAHSAGAANHAEDTFPTSTVQQGMLFNVLSGARPEVFLETFIVELSGDVNFDALAAAWGRVVALVPQFQICFDIPCQLTQSRATVARVSDSQDILDPKPDFVSVHETRGATLDHVRAYAHDDRAQGIELKDAPLLRVSLLRLGEASAMMVVTIHHLIIDGWSWVRVVQLLQREYAIVLASAGYSSGILHLLGDILLPERQARRNAASSSWLFKDIKVSGFSSVVAYERARAADIAVTHWAAELQGLEEERPHMTPDLSGADVIRQSETLDKGTCEALYALARSSRVTLASVAYAAWYIVHSCLLSHGKEDVILGCTTSRRDMPMPGLDAIVGPVVNTVPLRLHFDAAEEAVELLRSVHATVLGHAEHSWLPLARVQEVVGGQTLFDTIVDVQNEDGWSGDLGPSARMQFLELLDSIGTPLSVRVLNRQVDGSIKVALISETTSCKLPRVQSLLKAFVSVLVALGEHVATSSSSSSPLSVQALREQALQAAGHVADKRRDDGKASAAQSSAIVRLPCADEEKAQQRAADGVGAESQPTTEAQQQIVSACVAEILGKEVNAQHQDTNLFSLGLDSLRCLRLVAALLRGGLQATVRDIFEHPTIRGLATKAVAVEPSGSGMVETSAQSQNEGKNARDGLLFAIPRPADESCTPFPLTGITKAYWMGLWHNPYSPGGCFPQIAFEFDWSVKERIDVQRLSQCFDAFVRRHASFRAVVVKESPMMRYLSVDNLPSIQFAEATVEEGCDVNAACDAAYHEIFEESINPFSFPLFRGKVVHLPASAGGGSRFFYCVSLFVMDGITDLTWRVEISSLYRGQVLPERPCLTYKAYSEGYSSEAAGIKTSKKRQDAAAYWQDRVEKGLPPPPQLPTMKESPSNKGTFSHYGDAPLTAEQLQRLKDAAAKFGLTPTSVLLALYCLALARHAASSKMLINVLHCLRHPVHEDCERVLGNFSSSFLCPVDVAAQQKSKQEVDSPIAGWSSSASSISILEASRSVMESLVDCQARNTISGVDVMSMVNNKSAVPGRAAAPFIFVSAMGLEDAVPEWRDLCFLERRVTESTSGTYMVHAVKEYPDGSMYAGFNVIDGAFPEETLLALVADHRRLLDVVTADLSLSDSTAPSIWQAPLFNILDPTPIPSPISSMTSRQLFSRQLQQQVDQLTPAAMPPLLQDGLLHSAKSSPSHVAIIDVEQGVELSYGDIQQRAIAVAVGLDAHNLRNVEVRHQAPLVAVACEKSWQQVVACMGILLSGCAYLPLNVAAWPHLRIEGVLAAGEVVAIVTRAATAAAMPWLVERSVPVVDVDERSAMYISQEDIDATMDMAIRQQPSTLAYCIFTSGSTGRPKGVAMAHAGALNTIEALLDMHSLDSSLVTYGISQLAFDLSVSDIFLTQYAGGTLVLPSEQTLSPPDPSQWCRDVERCGVNLWNSVPALFGLLCEHSELFGAQLPLSIRLVWLSGDLVPEGLAARARQLGSDALRLFAMGGATEAGIWSNTVEITNHKPSDGIVPYGNALPGQGMHVARLEDFQPAAPGVPGMIVISGDSLMLGYYNDDVMTGRALVDIDGQRSYLTQDAGYTRRRAQDGQLEIVITGRIQDAQGSYVKVRGFRVELQEVEAALRSLDNVQSAAATVRDRSNIAAFVVLTEGVEMTPEMAEEMKQALRSVLPSYAIPHWIEALQQLPLSSNGKVDRAALPVPAGAATLEQMDDAEGTSHVSSLSKEEALVLDTAQGLGIKVRGAADSVFFAGADSVAVLRLVIKLEALRRVKLDAGAIFSDGSIAGIAKTLEQAQPVGPTRPLAELEMSILASDACPHGSNAHAPVFLCHGAGATSLSLGPLASALMESGEVGTIYGFSDTFLTSASTDFGYHSIEAVAEAMAKHILSTVKCQKRQSSVTLGGWSYGGVVAYACARLLETRGLVVRAVLLVDAPLGQQGGKTLQADVAKALQDAVGAELSERVAEHFSSCNDLLGAYQPLLGKPISSPVFDIRPVASKVDYLPASACSMLTQATWHHVVIPGADHFSLVQPKHARQVAGTASLLRVFQQTRQMARRRSASVS